MILIPPESLFVLGEGGQRQSYDFSALCADLRHSFHTNGICDSWLIDQFTLTVEERLRSKTLSPLSETEIDSLLGAVLTASGYSDVAKTFLSLRGTDSLASFRGALKPWDIKRLQSILRQQLPLSPCQLEQLSRCCEQTLNGLHFSLVSDTFIRELGIHLLQDSVPETGAAHPKAVEHSSDWHDHLTDHIRHLLQLHIFTVFPIAQLFPRPQIAIDLLANESFVKGWNSELSFGIQLPQLAADALQLLTAVRQDILTRRPDFIDCPGHIVIHHYALFLEQYLPGGTSRERRSLDKRLRQMLEANFTGRTSYDVMLSYR